MNTLKKILFGATDSPKQVERENVKERQALAKLNLSDIITVDFPDNQYFKEQTDKKQIVLHHTISGQGIDGDIAWWRSTADKVGTAILIDKNGKIYQCFSSKYWAYHLGINTANSKALNMSSIGIEIDAWGGLVKSSENGLWYPAKWDASVKKYVPNRNNKNISNVFEYPNGYRGFYGFEKYSDAQIEAIKQLLIYWGEKYKIPLDYNTDMWDISSKALSGQAGVWVHNSYRTDKSDCYPDDRLIDMLNNLK